MTRTDPPAGPSRPRDAHPLPDAQQRLLEIEALLATLAGEMPSA